MNCVMKTERWAVRTALMQHQQEAVAKLLPSRVGGLFMEMGTGKTLTAVQLAALRQHKIDRVIWYCPVAAKETIRREILKHTDCTPMDICVFGDKTDETNAPFAWWYIIGIESMSASARVVCTAQALTTERTMVVVDESTYIKGHRAKRTNRITWISQEARYRLILTGTPLTQGVVDLYAQMKFLSQKILGYSSWYSFSRNHLEYSERYKGKIDRCLNTDWIAAKIRPYVYQVTKDECLDLPPKMYVDRYCELTDEQWHHYERAKEDFMVDVMLYDNPYSQFESSIPIFRLFSRLQGIVCGYDGMGEKGDALPHSRLSLLLSVIEQVPKTDKIVIWAKYRRCVQEVSDALRTDYGDHSVVAYYGDIAERKRETELTRWRNDARFLVATQSLGGHALDLTAAHNVIFYANAFKYSERLQAEDRCHRIGQAHRTRYIDLWADCKIEQRISQALFNKGNVVEDFKKEVDKVKKSRKDRLREMVAQL